MVYIQITSKCNMRCRHCCVSAGPVGEDMTESTFEQCISFAEASAARTGRPLKTVIGGGEPTVHPHFREFLEAIEDRAYNRRRIEQVRVITNGKRSDNAFWLLEMTKRSSVLYACLSLDQYHEPISSAVICAWLAAAREHDNIESESGKIISNHGRARDNGLSILDYCCCPGPFIEPDGTIYGCGCKTERLGTVFNPCLSDTYIERMRKGATCSRGRDIPRQGQVGDRGNEDREELDMARFRTALAALPSRRARYV